jgi:hypothetical protein
MTREELTTWALNSGWKMIGGHACRSHRMVLKATVVNIEIKKPAGKWEKVSGANYGDSRLMPTLASPAGLGSLAFRVSPSSCGIIGTARRSASSAWPDLTRKNDGQSGCAKLSSCPSKSTMWK